MSFKKGDRVTFDAKADYGMGQVLFDNHEGNIEIYFVNVGKKTLSPQAKISMVPQDDARHPVLDNLYLDSKGQVSKVVKSLDELIRIFLSQFPDGFASEQYLADERNYKEAANKLFHEKLAKEELTTLIDKENFGEIAKRSMQVIGKTNLVFPNESMDLKDGLQNPEARTFFSVALNGLLYGAGQLQERVEAFIQALLKVGAPKWTILTYFLFIGFPDRFVFLKPTASQQAAEVFGFNIKYQSELNWGTFKAHQEFADYLYDQLHKWGAPMQPKDMIDVQGFIYRVSDLRKNMAG